MKTMTNNELFGASNLLAEIKICAAGVISPAAADKLVEAACRLRDAAEELQKRVDLVREKTRPDEVASIQDATEEQRAAWEQAMAAQLEILGGKPVQAEFDPLSADEFRQLLAANTLTGAQALLLRKVLVDTQGGKEVKDE